MTAIERERKRRSCNILQFLRFKLHDKVKFDREITGIRGEL